MMKYMAHFSPVIAAVIFALTATGLQADPQRYELDEARSKVGFSYQLLGADTQGSMKVKSADIEIDLDRLANSSARVTLDTTRAKGGLVLATQALRSDIVLDAARYPEIRFTSRKVRLNGAGRLSDGAEIDGELTVKGITRMITLRADLYRAPGSAADDLSALSFRLRGSLDRNAFEASGYPDLVGPEIAIDILAYVDQAN